MIQITEKAVYINLPIDAVGPKIVNSDDKEDLLALEFDIENTDEESGFYGEYVTHQINLPAGRWKLLFTDKTIDEEKAKMVVETIVEPKGRHVYKDYTTDGVWFYQPSLSFNSLLQSKGLTGSNYAIIEKV